ncbi:MAG: P1 family peptidase [Steroidobacteraceae bacterium]
MSSRFLLAFALLATTCAATPAEDKRPRLRDVGASIGVFDPGPLNAITDVRGVRGGHRTVIEGERIRTGVTAIVPHEGNVFQDYVIAFSTAQEVRRTPARRSSIATFPELPNEAMTPLFQAAAEATEEAIVNSLLQARPMRSALSSVGALDPEVVRRALR